MGRRHTRRRHRGQRGRLVACVLGAAVAAVVLGVQLKAVEVFHALPEEDGGGSGMGNAGSDAQQTAEELAANVSGSGSDGSDPGSGDNSASGLSFDTSALLHVTFAAAHERSLLANWATSVLAVFGPQQLLVGALDGATAAACAAAGWRHVRLAAPGPPVNSLDAELRRRQLRGADRRLGAAKLQLLLALLERHGVAAVMVSEPDAVWLGDPSPHLEAHPSADLLISTDCLSAEADEAWAPDHGAPGCGHVAGSAAAGAAFNAGLYGVRRRAGALELLHAWRSLLLDDAAQLPEPLPPLDEVPPRGSDRIALGVLLAENQQGLPASGADPRVVMARGGALTLHPLPLLRFAGGHVAFVQRAPEKHGVEPYVIHANSDRWHGADQVELEPLAKRARLREAGVWQADGPEYFGPARPRFLAYESDVAAWVAGWAAARGGEAAVPPLMRHLAAVAFQQAVFRDALAAALMLNRTLVLPPALCWCDMGWDPSVLESCTRKGSDLRDLPFRCPADYVFHVAALERAGVAHRVPGFLDDARAAAVRDAGPAVELRLGGARPAAGAAAAGQLWPNMTRADLLGVAGAAADAPVVKLSGLAPGLLAGWGDAQADYDFDVLAVEVGARLFWYSAAPRAEWDERVALLYPDAPRPFCEGFDPWVEPDLGPPGWCDAMAEGQAGTRAALRLPNHPCRWPRPLNATAASEATEAA